jgi:hypothetical protein
MKEISRVKSAAEPAEMGVVCKAIMFVLAVALVVIGTITSGCDAETRDYGDGDSDADSDGDSDGDADFDECPADVYAEFLSEDGIPFSVGFTAEEVGCAFVHEGGGMSGTCLEFGVESGSQIMEFVYQIGGDDGDIGMFGFFDMEQDEEVDGYIGGDCDYEVDEGKLSVVFDTPGLYVCIKDIPIETGDCWWCTEGSDGDVDGDADGDADGDSDGDSDADTDTESAAIVEDTETGHVYQLVEVIDGGLDWYEARAAAEAAVYDGMSGHLAVITSPAEQQFISENLPGIVAPHVWLGANDEESEDTWIWVTDEPWGYAAWDYVWDEPNGGTEENCLDISDGTNLWNDESCDVSLSFYLVEFEPE